MRRKPHTEAHSTQGTYIEREKKKRDVRGSGVSVCVRCSTRANTLMDATNVDGIRYEIIMIDYGRTGTWTQYQRTRSNASPSMPQIYWFRFLFILLRASIERADVSKLFRAQIKSNQFPFIHSVCVLSTDH